MQGNGEMAVLGMSGGVDSTAAALLLQKEGYRVCGATLRLQQEEAEQAGNALRDMADAKAACDALGIRHVTLDWRQRFKSEVLDAFAAAYAAGETPNPCAICNRRVKFPALFQLAEELGARYVATGHYAGISYDPVARLYRLKRSDNPRKDQSYALYSLSQAQLARILFPLGGYEKKDIRRMVEQAGLSAAKKADSQDICFVPEGDYTAFLERHTGCPCPEGDFVDESGNPLGRHRGLWRYTIGQRKGLGISFAKPMYVREIDAATGSILLGEDADLFASALTVRDLCWSDPQGLTHPARLTVKIRYAHAGAPATVEPVPGNRAAVTFDTPQRAITKGQAAVFYDGDHVLGGGQIE